MRLRELQRHWEEFAKTDPLWAILTDPSRKEQRWRTDEFFATGEADVSRLLDRLQTLNLPFRSTNALDFGCGVGRITRALSYRFDEACGIDVSPEMIRLAQDYNHDRPGCRFIVNATDHLPTILSDSYDFVYSALVLQHMTPKLAARYLRELVRILRPSGVLVIQMPTPQPDLEVPPSHRFKRHVPIGLVKCYRRVRRRLSMSFPYMAMYGMKSEEVISVTSSAGGAVLHVFPDHSHGTTWPGFQYIVTKR